MRIVIIGCGRVGSDLALKLDTEGHIVSVIDVQSRAFQSLGPQYGGTTYEGFAYDIETLRESGIENADAFVAATDSDNVNAIAVHIAKQVFSVPITVARLNDPRREKTYRVLNIPFIGDAAVTSDAIHDEIVSKGAQPRTR